MPGQCTCARCGRVVFVRPSEIGAGRRFCSRRCGYLSRRKAARDGFWAKVDTSGDCWTWTGRRDANGYGQLRTTSHPCRYERAHRAAWEMVAGPIPERLLVGHTCDTRHCVRNDDEGWYEVGGVMRPRRGHLWVGTQGENMLDMARKRRSTRLLDDDAVADILACHAPNGAGGMGIQALARKHGVGPGVVGRVLRAHGRLAR